MQMAHWGSGGPVHCLGKCPTFEDCVSLCLFLLTLKNLNNPAVMLNPAVPDTTQL